MVEWLADQARTAGPFIATFCLVACGILGRVIVVLARHHLRTTDVILRNAKAMERWAQLLENELRKRNSRGGRR